MRIPLFSLVLTVLYLMQWLYNKMCALPLPEVLGDFEDAIKVEHFNPSLNGPGAYKGDILKTMIFNILLHLKNSKY